MALIKSGVALPADSKSRAFAQQAVFEYIEVFCNRRRRHSTIGYKTPAQQEEIYRSAAQTP
jgi:hypothetical protein